MPGLTGLEFLELLRAGRVRRAAHHADRLRQHRARGRVDQGGRDRLHHQAGPARAARARGEAGARGRAPAPRERRAASRGDGVPQRAQIIGDSAAIRRVLQTVATAAPTRATVLLQGESGTGKELFARAIHDASDRRDGPFIKLNCAALPEGLSRARCSATRRARSPARSSASRARSSGRTAARCCSTRSARCASTFRPSCCACCRSRSSSASAGRSPSRSTCASSRRRTAISRVARRKDSSGRISTTD